MTSNVGAREMAQRALGFGETEGGVVVVRNPKETEADRAVERLFSPEFRNRLDARLKFNPLSPEVMEKIVDKFVRQLGQQLEEKKVTIELTGAARTLLAEKGFDPATFERIWQDIEREFVA